MTSTASFLSSLRALGVSIRSKNGRILVEAPAGVISKRTREELIERKAELIQALQREESGIVENSVCDPQNIVADLLALAYQRVTKVSRVGGELLGKRLAKAADQSVHGVVQ